MFATQSKQRSSFHGSEPDSVMSAAMNVSTAASSVQPQFIRRAASIPADDAACAKLVGLLSRQATIACACRSKSTLLHVHCQAVHTSPCCVVTDVVGVWHVCSGVMSMGLLA